MTPRAKRDKKVPPIVVKKRRPSDTTPPTISSIVGVPGQVTWTTNEPATSVVEYGGSTSGYAAVIAADSPVAHWRLGESSGTSAAEEIGTATGTYVNTPTLGATGLQSGDSDTAVSFDRTATEYVDITANMPAGASAGITVECLVKINSALAVGDKYRIFGWGTITTAPHHLLVYRRYDTTTWLFTWYWYDGTTARSSSASVTGAPLNEDGSAPNHLAVAHDYTGKTLKVYVDGTLVSTVDLAAYASPSAISAGTAARIAAAVNNTLDLFSGVLDEVAIYNSPLSATQISDHAAARTASGGGYTYSYSDPTLVTSHNALIPSLTAGTKFIVKSADVKGNLATSTEQTVAEGGTGGTLQDRINAASAGATLNLGSEVFTAAATVNKALTINGGILNVGAATAALTISASGVTINGMVITGAQSHNLITSEYGIRVNTAISDLTITNCTISNFGFGGIWLDRVTSDLSVTYNTITDIFYAGIMVLSCSGGDVSHNIIKRIGVGWTTGGNGGGFDVNNAYGIALSASNTPTIRTSNVTVTYNDIEDVPTWHAIDTHSGADLTFAYNTIRRTSRPIFLTNAGYEPLRCDVHDNVIESPSPVTFNLVAITLYDTNTCSVTNNEISSVFPDQNQYATPGDDRVYDYALASTGLTVSGNTLI